jgi:hypothetical protein
MERFKQTCDYIKERINPRKKIVIIKNFDYDDEDDDGNYRIPFKFKMSNNELSNNELSNNEPLNNEPLNNEH